MLVFYSYFTRILRFACLEAFCEFHEQTIILNVEFSQEKKILSNNDTRYPKSINKKLHSNE